MNFRIFHKRKNKEDSMIIPSKTKVTDLLPIGSVVRIDNCNYRLVIIGIKQLSTIDNHEYDYLTVPYPMGIMGDDSELLINHDDIIEINFVGYQDSERMLFIEQLEEYVKR